MGHLSACHFCARLVSQSGGPFQVLRPSDAKQLSEFGEQAVNLKNEERTSELSTLEENLNRFVRGIYGIPMNATLWVTR
jgi:hypothetical protein